MTDTVIRVENLGKEYRLGKREGYRTLRDSITETAAAAWNRLTFRKPTTPANDSTFWALRDVSFEVKQGEVVGVIGRNGAGKSTLLKILSQITEPTTGRIELTGRVGSLLEVGTGFHPELTGRENIYLNGAILGMKRSEITRKFDEIVAFAEVEKFIDTPVKHYSSGMYMRLAFAVAAHLEPEILIVDEVLAVGDAEFQKKCLGKMGEVARHGRTVLFVSHNMSAVQTLCQKALYLVSGRIHKNGLAMEVIRDYLCEPTLSLCSPSSRVELGTEFELLKLSLQPNVFPIGTVIKVSIQIRATADVTLFGLCMIVSSELETRVALIDLRANQKPIRIAASAEATFDAVIENVNLVEGRYKLGLHINSTNTQRDFNDLGIIDVTPRIEDSPTIQYPVSLRGYVNLPAVQICATVHGNT
jgi:lipopolysaccharide transport system ATP-binding protein